MLVSGLCSRQAAKSRRPADLTGPQDSCSRARWFSSFLDQRIRIARLRFSHERQASMTQRAGAPARGRSLSAISSPRGTDVRRDAVLLCERVDRRRVVGAVQAHSPRRLGHRLGALDRDRLERLC
jgi:hypothetical protein